MSEFKREGRYIVVKPDCEDSLRTERLRNYIDEMCFSTPDCVVVEADWPEYEPVWRMIERRVSGLPDELVAAQSELSALREELSKIKVAAANVIGEGDKLQQRLTAAEQRNAELDTEWSRTITDRGLITLERDKLRAFAQHMARQQSEPYFAQLAKEALKPTESGASE